MSKKRLIGYFVGGGVGLTVATLSGLQLNDHLQYRSKVNYFSKFTQNFRLRAPEQFKAEKFYLPEWNQDGLWSFLHYEKSKPRAETKEWEKFKARFPTVENFKDWCLEEARKDENFENCNSEIGLCNDCLFKPEWDKDYEKFKSSKK